MCISTLLLAILIMKLLMGHKGPTNLVRARVEVADVRKTMRTHGFALGSNTWIYPIVTLVRSGEIESIIQKIGRAHV